MKHKDNEFFVPRGARNEFFTAKGIAGFLRGARNHVVFLFYDNLDNNGQHLSLCWYEITDSLILIVSLRVAVSLIASAMTTMVNCRCPVGIFLLRFMSFRNL